MFPRSVNRRNLHGRASARSFHEPNFLSCRQRLVVPKVFENGELYLHAT